MKNDTSPEMLRVERCQVLSNKTRLCIIRSRSWWSNDCDCPLRSRIWLILLTPSLTEPATREAFRWKKFTTECLSPTSETPGPTQCNAFHYKAFIILYCLMHKFRDVSRITFNICETKHKTKWLRNAQVGSIAITVAGRCWMRADERARRNCRVILEPTYKHTVEGDIISVAKHTRGTHKGRGQINLIFFFYLGIRRSASTSGYLILGSSCRYPVRGNRNIVFITL
jgi:hypothetical protein